MIFFNGKDICTRPKITKEHNLVYGDVKEVTSYHLAHIERGINKGNYCGPEGRFWTPKVKEQVQVKLTLEERISLWAKSIFKQIKG